MSTAFALPPRPLSRRCLDLPARLRHCPRQPFLVCAARLATPAPAKQAPPLRSGPPPPVSRVAGPAVAVAAVSALAPAAPAHAVALSLHDALLGGALFSPLNTETDAFIRTLVWTDFRLAVALFVVSPLALFAWSFARGGADDAVKRVMVGYWQASSLLMLTVFLNIAQVPLAAFTGMFVQAMIPVALTWWTDLLQEIRADQNPLSRAFLLWRILAIVAAGVGVAVQLPFQGCNLERQPLSNPMCAAWIEPPQAFHDILLADVAPDALKTLAVAGCTVYFGYLVYLAGFVVPKVGRFGRMDRDMFSSVSVLRALGLIDEQSKGT